VHFHFIWLLRGYGEGRSKWARVRNESVVPAAEQLGRSRREFNEPIFAAASAPARGWRENLALVAQFGLGSRGRAPTLSDV